MVQRFIESEFGLNSLIRFLQNQKDELPFTVSISRGGKRSDRQNRLFHMWIGEIQRQNADESHEWWRGYCKLVIGVPILRQEDEAFREAYDQSVKGLPFEQKLRCMMEPIAMPVTSRMTTKQMTMFLDGVHRHFAEQGIELSVPEDLRYAGLEAGRANA
jgi:hypothetical protein